MNKFFKRLFGIRCFHCKKSDGDLKSISWTESKAADPKYFYHQECLRNVLDNPDSCDSQTIEDALQITYALSCRYENRQRNIERIKNLCKEEKKPVEGWPLAAGAGWAPPPPEKKRKKEKKK
jgi:hypothetical protein